MLLRTSLSIPLHPLHLMPAVWSQQSSMVSDTVSSTTSHWMTGGTNYEPPFMWSALPCPGTPNVLLWLWPQRSTTPLHFPCRVASQKWTQRPVRAVVVFTSEFSEVSQELSQPHTNTNSIGNYVNTEGCFYIVANEFRPVWIWSQNYLTDSC